VEKQIEKNKIFSLMEPFSEKVILEKGQSVARDGKFLPFSYLASGRVRVFMESDDEEKRTYMEVEAGEFLGETTYYDCDFHQTVIVALEECHILSVPLENLKTLKSKIPEIDPNVYNSLGNKVKYLAQAEKEERVGVIKRIARAMLQISKGLETRYGDEVWAVLKCPREDIAILAKTSVTTATNEIKVMQIDGILYSKFKRIEIKDIDALKKIAGV